MKNAQYTEDALVEQPAIALLSKLGWETVDAYGEFQHGSSFLERETKAEVVLKSRLRAALLGINPDAPPEAIHAAIEELTRDRSVMDMTAANREIHRLIKDGVRVTVPDPEGDGETVELVRVIDWDNTDNNDYLCCSQFWVTGEMRTCRADLVCFVNGLPLVLFELKASHKRLETAYNENLSDYKDTIPQLFQYNALIIISNASRSLVGSVSAGLEHFARWKKVANEEEEARVSLETMLRGVCEPGRLLDIVENFTVFQEKTGGLTKLIPKNHQYLGVNNAMEALADIRRREGKLGVFWHTQGSGKSVSMLFFSQKVLRKTPGNWTFVIVTDRKELDGQIYKNFASANVVTEARAQAEDSAHLRRLLKEDHRYVFTLIHKFRTAAGEKHPVLSERRNIIVITDEAHRSQYDTLALNMRTALPNAGFLAFTGTPLIAGEQKTRQVFGDYVSIYDFQESVEDGATVPLYYENRIPELQLSNENFNEDMERLLEEAELDEQQEAKLDKEFAREYHLITREERLETIAKDMVDHFMRRGFQGKAMMVCIDKATAVRMHDKVRQYWDKAMEKLREQKFHAVDEDCEEIESRIELMRETDMAVVVSQSQNEIAEMAEIGADIRPHRKRMLEEDLESKFKDADDPLRLVFVCAMWMTGFDVPACSTLYLDKPMKNHTLMQTIARANRVYPGKVNGLIVDYCGVFRSLEKALAIYGDPGDKGKRPVEDKDALRAALRELLTESMALCRERGVDPERISSAEGFECVRLIGDAADALIYPETVKNHFLDLVNTVQRLYKTLLPDQSAHEFEPEVKLLRVIADKIRSETPQADISQVMSQVEQLLDRSVAAESYVIRESKAGEYNGGSTIDLSDLDFDLLSEQFKPGRKRTVNERLKGKVAQKLKIMIQLNRTRVDYMERFQAMIESYNAGSMNAEEFFRRLRVFAKSLEEEESRAITEQLSEEELAIFDLLTKPAVEMSDAERNKVKVTARSLLDTLKKEKFVLDWRKRQQTRAEVRVAIETLLDRELPEVYTHEMFEQKATAVFQHVYDAYYGGGQSIYACTY